MPVIRLDAARLVDWESFHRIFASTFGFPEFYGGNMNAWIDCMSSLDAPEEGLTKVHGSASYPVVLRLDNADDMPREIFDALIEDAAFVNWRRLEGSR